MELSIYLLFTQRRNFKTHPKNSKKVKINVCLCFRRYFYHLRWPLQIMGRTFYKNTKKTSLYSQRILIFIHKTPVVKNHLTNRRNKRITTTQVNTDGNHGLFLHEQLTHLHTGNTQKKVLDIASEEDIMEND